MKKNKTVKKQKLDKKNFIIWLIHVIIFIFLIISMIFGSYLITNKFSYLYKLGISYSGGYKVQINVFNTAAENYDPTIPNGDNEKGLYLLKNKLDPLNNSNLYLQTLGKHGLELKIGKQNFKSYNNLKGIIQRLGAIYLTNKYGTDLLINNKERIPLSDVIYNAKSGISIQRKPMITLKIKDTDKWNSIISKLNLKQNKQPEKLYIWTDIGQFIDDLRNDISNVSLIMRNFQTQIIDKIKNNNDRRKVRDIFNIEYKDIHSGGQIKHDNLLSMSSALSIASLKEIMNEDSFKFTDVKLDNLVIDPNKKDNIKNDYVDPLFPYLVEILDWSKEINNKYKKFLLNYNSLNGKIQMPKSQNEIYTTTETETKTISNLVNGGLSGLKFVVRGYNNISPIISANILKSLWIILEIASAIIATYLIIYYRLFGMIAILTLFLTIVTTLYFSSLLSVQISPDNIVAIIIAAGLALEGNLLLFARYKRERYINNLPYEPAMKIANKQTIAIFLDTLIIIIILGLSLFWIGTNNIKSFATILLIGLIVSFFLVFIITRLMYLIIIKLKWQTKIKWLDIPKLSLYTAIKEKKQKKISTNLNIVPAKAKETIISNNLFVLPSNNNENINLNTYENIKQNKNKSKNEYQLSYYNFIKWISLIGIILFIIAFIIAMIGKANIDSSIKSGTNIIIYSNNWQTQDQNKEIQFIKKNVEEFKKQSVYNFSYNIYVITTGAEKKENSILVVSTNISKNSVSRNLLKYIAMKSGLTLEDPGFGREIIKPLMVGHILKITLISLSIGIACIFIYTLCRLNWSQFFGILISALFVIGSTLSLVIIFQILIIFEMSIAFIAIFIFAFTFSAIVMARSKQNKKIINIKEYETFFKYMSDYNHKIKQLKKAHKVLYFNKEFKKLMLANPDLHKKAIKQNFKTELKQIYQKSQEIKKNNKIKIKQNKKEFKKHNYKYNLLQKIANITIKQMMKHYLIIGTILTIILVLLTIFSGSLFGFTITIIIGFLLSIFSSLFVSIPIWVLLEKHYILNKFKIKNFLNTQHIEIYEQDVLGINC